MIGYNMMIPRHWRKLQGEPSVFMINIEKKPLTKMIGKTIRNEIWSKERMGPSHHYSEIIFRDNQLPRSPQ
jgi:hypothetical protein